MPDKMDPYASYREPLPQISVACEDLMMSKKFRRPTAMTDLVIITAVVVGFFVLAAHLELSEKLSTWGRSYEHWQLDELPLTLLLLSVGLGWFSQRRWRELVVEVRARRAAEATGTRMLEQNRRLARQLIQLQEQERRHLARELHDELGQCCVAIKVDASSIAHDTRDRLETAYACARAIEETADHLQDVVRSMLRRLRPMGLDELGLAACLQVLTASWSERHGTACVLTADGVLDGLDEAINIAIYRTVQESLTNIAKHARANRVVVDIHRPAAAVSEGDCITLRIDDDGEGMCTDSIGEGLGVFGMCERVHALGGRLSVATAPSGGTRVDAVLPVTGGMRQAA
jgi:signal transduction histidine kinase